MQSNVSSCVARLADDPLALAELYDATSRLVFGLVYRILRRRDEAEEVTLDVYAQVWRTAADYDPRRGSVEAWLTTIARSRAVDRRRSRGVRPDLVGTATDTFGEDSIAEMVEPEEFLAALDARRSVETMMGRLAPEERRLVELAFYEGYTHAELASLLRLPLGTVKTRIRNALTRMRRALDQKETLSPLEPRGSTLLLACVGSSGVGRA